jgi:hypothetical protein
MGLEVCHAALKFLNFMIMDNNINATRIAFIPKNTKNKKTNPCSVVDFRPISLYNVLYKIIAKVLVNRLTVCSSPCYKPQSKCLLSRQFNHKQHHSSLRDFALYAYSYVEQN